MPLRLVLKPAEKIIVNGAVIANGSEHSMPMVFVNEARILRESEIIRESQADTAAKRICVSLQAIYLAEPHERAPMRDALVRQMTEMMRAAPSTMPFMTRIDALLDAGKFHAALKAGRELVAYETRLIARLDAPAAPAAEAEEEDAHAPPGP